MHLALLIKKSKAFTAEEKRALQKTMKHFSLQMKERLQSILTEEVQIQKKFPKLFAILKKHLHGEIFKIVEQGLKKIKKRQKHFQKALSAGRTGRR